LSSEQQLREPACLCNSTVLRNGALTGTPCSRVGSNCHASTHAHRPRTCLTSAPWRARRAAPSVAAAARAPPVSPTAHRPPLRRTTRSSKRTRTNADIVLRKPAPCNTALCCSHMPAFHFRGGLQQARREAPSAAAARPAPLAAPTARRRAVPPRTRSAGASGARAAACGSTRARRGGW
jgi:hypothetical protein